MSDAWDYVAVAILGLLVGLAELVSRYRDTPQAAIVKIPALVYVGLNVAASILALALIRGYNWTFNTAGASQRWTQMLVAGVGAMAVFRTSLFVVRAGDRDIGVGPGGFLQIFRDAADREVDRLRATARSVNFAKLMKGLDYKKTSEGLVPYCLALMQNVPGEEQQKLQHAVDLLTKDDTCDDAIKVRILGLHLLNVVGPAVLTAAVEALRDEPYRRASTGSTFAARRVGTQHAISATPANNNATCQVPDVPLPPPPSGWQARAGQSENRRSGCPARPCDNLQGIGHANSLCPAAHHFVVRPDCAGLSRRRAQPDQSRPRRHASEGAIQTRTGIFT
ncbi:MAG TPA: hypothetical protein VN924_28575 [Bryobacteraceae bacterium]|nr:hypothetical protein [Bryobacteraceae bacterium]